jgi:hypothetical protein
MNGRQLLQALEDLGFGSVSHEETNVLNPMQIIQRGIRPCKLIYRLIT